MRIQRNSGKGFILIIIISILTVGAEFAICKFLGTKGWYALSLIPLLLLGCFILLENTLRYEALFFYSLLTILPSLGIYLFFSEYQTMMLLFIIFSILIPVIYGIQRDITNHGRRYEGFYPFFRNISIVSILLQLGWIIPLLFVYNKNYVLYYNNFTQINIIPFYTLASLIEGYLDKTVVLFEIFYYLFLRITPFIAYGFYGALCLRNQSRFLRLLLLFFLPIVTEGVQRIFLLGKGDVDDVIFGFLGGLLGLILYKCLNSFYQVVKDEDFLTRRPSFPSYRNSLYF